MFGKLSIIVKKTLLLRTTFLICRCEQLPWTRGLFSKYTMTTKATSFEPLHKAALQDKGLTPQQTKKEGVAQHSTNITMSDSHELQ